MGVLSLSMAKPKVIDLTKFKGVYNEAEVTINDAVLQAVQTSMSSGGTLATVSVTGIEGFFEGITPNRSVTVRSALSGNAYIQNQPAIYYENSVPVMLCSSYAAYTNGLLVDLKACFLNFSDSDKVTVRVSAKLIA